MRNWWLAGTDSSQPNRAWNSYYLDAVEAILPTGHADFQSGVGSPEALYFKELPWRPLLILHHRAGLCTTRSRRFPGRPVAPPAPQRVCFARHLHGLSPGQITPTCQSRLGHQHQDRQAFCDDIQNVIRKPGTASFLLAEFLGDDEVRPVDERAPQRRASVGECGRIERAASAIRPRVCGGPDRRKKLPAPRHRRGSRCPPIPERSRPAPDDRARRVERRLRRLEFQVRCSR